MLLRFTAAILATAMLLLSQEKAPVVPSSSGYTPSYTKDGRLFAPTDYREWVFLSSGFNMSYVPGAKADGMSIFDNVFVNPAAYKAFLATGTWPDKTVLVLESRGAQSKGSINQSGNYQGTGVMGVEVHIKDAARFPGKWAFFDFDNDISGNLIPQAAACYSCHQQHAAVDTTFVQFYPTVIGIATKKGTLAPAYLSKPGDSPGNK